MSDEGSNAKTIITRKVCTEERTRTGINSQPTVSTSMCLAICGNGSSGDHLCGGVATTGVHFDVRAVSRQNGLLSVSVVSLSLGTSSWCECLVARVAHTIHRIVFVFLLLLFKHYIKFIHLIIDQ